MLELPKLKNSKSKTKKYMYSFGGINNLENYTAGELETSENAGFDSYPALSVRRKRVKTAFGTAEDLFYANGMFKIFNTTQKVDAETGETVRTCNISYRKEDKSGYWTGVGVLTADGASGTSPIVGKSGKEVKVLGKIAVVFPDKKYIDLDKLSLGWKNIEGEISYSKDAAYVWNNRLVFATLENFTAFKNLFKVGDVVDFAGGYYVDNKAVRADGKKIIRAISSNSEKTVTFDPYSFGDAKNSYSAPMTFTKTVPELTNICVWNGRLWGIDKDRNICASKYMDPTVFEYFDLSSADSYTIETDTTGDFTGVAALSNHIVFFKENKIHRITGTKPSNYRHTVLDVTGISKGSDRSCTIIDEAVYYAGKYGIYVYDGGGVRRISEKLGTLVFNRAVGGADGTHYLISLEKADGSCELYCYDIVKDTWLKEDSLGIKAAFNFLGGAHYLAEDGNIYCLEAEKDTETEFSVTLREIGEKFSEKKGYSRLYLEYQMSEGGSIKAEVAYSKDASKSSSDVAAEEFKTVAVFTNHRKTVSQIRLEPNRTDFIRLRLTATGDVIIRRIMREYYEYGTTV